MKLLQVNTVYQEKSTGRTTYELEQYLQQKGWECYVAYSDGPDKADNFIRLGGLNAHRIHCRLARLFGMQGFFSPISAKRLVRYMEKIQPDVVHLRNLHDNYLSLMPVLDYLVENQIPTVVTLHDFWLFTGGCCLHTDYDCNKWIEGQCVDCPQAKKESLVDLSTYVQEKKLQAFSKLKKLAVVGVSQWATDEFVAADKLPHAKTMTIYNWVDFRTFFYRPIAKKEVFRGLVENEFVIIGVATAWSALKGLNDFLELAKKAGPGYKIVLVGQLPKGLELPENVISLGVVRDVNALADCYRAADVFVSFSARETFGKVIAEALSCGCPAVVYDVTACGEIAGEECGFCVQLGDVDAAWEKIQEIHKRSKAFYLEKCLDRTRRLFDLQTNAGQYEALYKQLMKD